MKTRAPCPARDSGYSGAGRRREERGERSGVGYHTRAGGRKHGCGKGSREARLTVGQYADTVHRLFPWSLCLLLLLRNIAGDNVSNVTCFVRAKRRHSALCQTRFKNSRLAYRWYKSDVLFV